MIKLTSDKLLKIEKHGPTTYPFYLSRVSLARHNIQYMYMYILFCRYISTLKIWSTMKDVLYLIQINAKIKVAVSVDKQHTLIRIYMEKYNSV